MLTTSANCQGRWKCRTCAWWSSGEIMCWPVGSLRYHPTTTPCSRGRKRCAAASVRCAMKIRLVSPSGGASSWMAGRHRTDCAVGGGCAGNSLIMLPRCTGPARNTRRGLRPPPPPAMIPPMTRSPVIRVGFAVVLCLLPAPRSLLPVVVEYPLPRPKAFPHDPAVGADGIVWYTDQANSYIGRLDPATGKVTDYATPTPTSGPHGIVVAPDGGVWYTGNFTGRLGRLDPATGVIKEYPLPSEARDPHTPLFHQGKG